ncbi:Hypothetical_protein [Hexamita inflata]|uniref:Hypothetical_protein n=1 Tax=Hexamita inflata TaxID=28002 RepID=A0AA86NL16_9EUKA|nr:Hypothetical protein HINF_LOCUS8689 [Hexamita inflata]
MFGCCSVRSDKIKQPDLDVPEIDEKEAAKNFQADIIEKKADCDTQNTNEEMSKDQMKKQLLDGYVFSNAKPNSATPQPVNEPRSAKEISTLNEPEMVPQVKRRVKNPMQMAKVRPSSQHKEKVPVMMFDDYEHKSKAMEPMGNINIKALQEQDERFQIKKELNEMQADLGQDEDMIQAMLEKKNQSGKAVDKELFNTVDTRNEAEDILMSVSTPQFKKPLILSTEIKKTPLTRPTALKLSTPHVPKEAALGAIKKRDEELEDEERFKQLIGDL